MIPVLVTLLTLACSDGRERAATAQPRVSTEEIPCEPRRVLERVCQQCHSEPQRNGAPFALVTYGDISARIDERPIAYWMDRALTEGAMPLPPVQLSDSDRDTLLWWLRAGAPPRGPSDSCD